MSKLPLRDITDEEIQAALLEGLEAQKKVWEEFKPIFEIGDLYNFIWKGAYE